jgi:hypothetical protein
VGRPHVGHPVAHGLVDGLLQRPLARLDSAHLGPHEPHAEDIQGLPLHVDGAHVDHAFESKLGADGRGRDAVLAGTRLRYDPLLAHPESEKGLPYRVVDLVGTRVEQVLTLEKDLCPADMARQALGKIERGRSPCELGKMPPQVGLKPLVRQRRAVDGLQLLERRHQGLGNEDAPVRAKMAKRVGNRGAVQSGCG